MQADATSDRASDGVGGVAAPSEDLTAIAAEIRQRVAAEVRAAMGRQRPALSGVKLAARLGWNRQAMQRRLSGAVAFTSEELVQVAEALHVPVATLLALPGDAS